MMAVTNMVHPLFPTEYPDALLHCNENGEVEFIELLMRDWGAPFTTD